MAKIITKKSQIPKYAAKRIKDFKNLTTNQAIYEYELQKLVRRSKGDYKYYAQGFYQRPERVTKKDIENVHSMRGSKLKLAQEDWEHEKRLNRFMSERTYYEPEDSIPDIDYTPSYEPDYSFDLNEEIHQEISYQSPEEYLEETGQVVNPLTGEVISGENIADMVDFARQYLDELEQVVRMEEDRTIVAMSSYRNGRTRNARSQKWITDNVTRAGDMILNQLDSIRSSDSKLVSFAKRFSDQSALQSLSDAIAEYIQGSYHVINTTGSFQSSRVYGLLNDGPISLSDSMEFEDEE